MADSRGIRAGRAYVELGVSDKLSAGLRRAQRRLQAFGAGVASIGTHIAAIAGGAVAAIGVPTIKAASDAQETLSKFEAVFGTQAAAAKQFAKTLSESVGRSKFEILDALATFQSFFSGLGFDGGKAREMSQTLTELAIDFASFNNLSDEEGIERFISALSGSSEVLDRFGINIKQAALEQELLRMGIHKSWTEVTEQEKSLARLNVIMRAMGDQGAVGDATRTADSFANRMKRLRGEVRDAAVAVGRALLPVLTPLVQVVTAAVQAVRSWAEHNPRLVATVAKVALGVTIAGTAIATFGAIAIGTGAALWGMAVALEAISAAIGFILSPIGLTIAAMVGLGTVILKYTAVGGEALHWLMERFSDLRDWVGKVIGGIVDAIKAGDITLAMQVVGAGVKVAWNSALDWLYKKWIGIRTSILNNIVGWWTDIESAWAIGINAILGLFDRLRTGAYLAWNDITDYAAKRANDIHGFFDKSFDSAAANKFIDQIAQARVEDEIGKLNDKLGQRNEHLDQKLAKYVADGENLKRGIAAAAADDARRFEDELAKAQAELNAAIVKAKTARESAAKDGTTGAPDLDKLLQDVQDKLGSIGNSLAGKVSTRGTLSGFSFQALQATADQPLSEVARNTGESVRLQKAMLNRGLPNTQRFA